MKKWYTSKTLWVNFIALLCLIIQENTKIVLIPQEVQLYVLGVINVILRSVTNTRIDWK